MSSASRTQFLLIGSMDSSEFPHLMLGRFSRPAACLNHDATSSSAYPWRHCSGVTKMITVHWRRCRRPYSGASPYTWTVTGASKPRLLCCGASQHPSHHSRLQVHGLIFGYEMSRVRISHPHLLHTVLTTGHPMDAECLPPALAPTLPGSQVVDIGLAAPAGTLSHFLVLNVVLEFHTRICCTQFSQQLDIRWIGSVFPPRPLPP